MRIQIGRSRTSFSYPFTSLPNQSAFSPNKTPTSPSVQNNCNCDSNTSMPSINKPNAATNSPHSLPQLRPPHITDPGVRVRRAGGCRTNYASEGMGQMGSGNVNVRSCTEQVSARVAEDPRDSGGASQPPMHDEWYTITSAGGQ